MDVDKFISRATQALRKRNPAQAIALYKQVLLAKPGHPEARGGLLSAYRRKAELRGGPKLPDRLAAKGLRATALALRGSRKLEAVVKTCDAGLERDPTDLALVAVLAGALDELGYQGSSLAAWRYRLELDDGDVEALKSAGKLHWALREIDQAIDCLERAHRLDPRDPEIGKLRKNLAAEGTLKSTRYASATSSQELVRDKDAMQKAERQQRLHRTGGELAADVESLTAAYAEAPTAALRRQLVAALRSSGQLDRARGVVDEALTASPEDDELLDARGDLALAVNRAAIESAAGDAEAARRLKDERAVLEAEEFGRRARRAPGDAELRLKLARALYRAGDVDGAIESFQLSVKDPRTQIESQEGLGACFFKKGLLPLAARQFEGALEASGGVAGDRGKEICYHLGLVAERQGDASGALERYLQIYEVDINFKDVASKIEALNR